MSYEIWTGIAISCFCVAAICLVVAVLMFVRFDIPRIRKELSGKMVENYMEEYRKKKEENKRVGIYDPSGKLIKDVRSSAVGKQPRGNTGKMKPPVNPAANNNISMGEAMEKARASATVKSESDTQVLARNNSRKDFVILKEYVFTECSEYIG